MGHLQKVMSAKCIHKYAFCEWNHFVNYLLLRDSSNNAFLFIISLFALQE